MCVVTGFFRAPSETMGATNKHDEQSVSGVACVCVKECVRSNGR